MHRIELKVSAWERLYHHVEDVRRRFSDTRDTSVRAALQSELQRSPQRSGVARHAVHGTLASLNDNPDQHGSAARPAAGSNSLHCTRFYDDERLLVDELARYAGTVLRNGHTAIVIARPALRHQLALALERERARSLLAKSGTLIALDAQETLAKFMIKDWPHEGMFNHSVGKLIERCTASDSVVAAYGEMVALLCEDGNFEAALRLEKLWNALLARRCFSLFCAYPARLFTSPTGAAWHRHLCEAHQQVLGA